MSKVILYENEARCCGCTACVSICPKNAISMHENAEGFLYPIINDALCVACRLCTKVCPIGGSDMQFAHIKKIKSDVI